METRKQKYLVWDVETFPILGAVWGKYEQNLLWTEREGCLASFAYKWLGEKRTHVFTLPDYKTYKKNKYDDIELVLALHGLFQEADGIIAHNGDSFDQKIANGRFLIHGLEPPPPYKQIDTLKIARKYFKLKSNKLDDLGDALGVGRKVRTGGIDLWHDCYYGDLKAWKKMATYNKQDVDLLEAVYLKLRPWVQNHPSMAVQTNKLDACKACNENKGFAKQGFQYTPSGKYQRYKCLNCGYSYNIERNNIAVAKPRFK